MSWFNKYSTKLCRRAGSGERLKISSSQRSLFTTFKWRLAKWLEADEAAVDEVVLQLDDVNDDVV